MPPKSEETKPEEKAADQAAAAPATTAVEAGGQAPPAIVADAEAAEVAEAAEAPQAPPHTAYLDHDDPDAAASHLGVDIVRGDNGLYLVPLAFAEALQPHGFRVVSEGK